MTKAALSNHVFILLNALTAAATVFLCLQLYRPPEFNTTDVCSYAWVEADTNLCNVEKGTALVASFGTARIGAFPVVLSVLWFLALVASFFIVYFGANGVKSFIRNQKALSIVYHLLVVATVGTSVVLYVHFSSVELYLDKVNNGAFSHLTPTSSLADITAHEMPHALSLEDEGHDCSSGWVLITTEPGIDPQCRSDSVSGYYRCLDPYDFTVRPPCSHGIANMRRWLFNMAWIASACALAALLVGWIDCCSKPQRSAAGAAEPLLAGGNVNGERASSIDEHWHTWSRIMRQRDSSQGAQARGKCRCRCRRRTCSEAVDSMRMLAVPFSVLVFGIVVFFWIYFDVTVSKVSNSICSSAWGELSSASCGVPAGSALSSTMENVNGKLVCAFVFVLLAAMFHISGTKRAKPRAFGFSMFAVYATTIPTALYILLFMISAGPVLFYVDPSEGLPAKFANLTAVPYPTSRSLPEHELTGVTLQALQAEGVAPPCDFAVVHGLSRLNAAACKQAVTNWDPTSVVSVKDVQDIGCVGRHSFRFRSPCEFLGDRFMAFHVAIQALLGFVAVHMLTFTCCLCPMGCSRAREPREVGVSPPAEGGGGEGDLAAAAEDSTWHWQAHEQEAPPSAYDAPLESSYAPQPQAAERKSDAAGAVDTEAKPAHSFERRSSSPRVMGATAPPLPADYEYEPPPVIVHPPPQEFHDRFNDHLTVPPPAVPPPAFHGDIPS